MYFLLLCILSSTGIFLVFKITDRLQLSSFPIIVINYLTATILGFALSPGLQADGIGETGWLPFALLIGVLFIIMFFLVARSSATAGISVTTIASKMSVIFPIAFSMFIDSSDKPTLIKLGAILFAMAGVILTVWKSGSARGSGIMLIPLLLFTGMGLVDSLVKYAQHRFVDDADTALFSAILFLVAFLTGVLVLMFRIKHLKSFRSARIWVWGVLLGCVNFGSIYFMVRALNYRNAQDMGIDSSIIFGVNNSGIVVLSVMAGFLIFREKLSGINWLGVALSVIALLLFSFGS